MNSPDVLASLLQCCANNGVFVADAGQDRRADLLESGMVDSMGLLMMALAIEETFNVAIPESVFVAELRNLERIAAYLEIEIRAGRGQYAAAPVAG